MCLWLWINLILFGDFGLLQHKLQGVAPPAPPVSHGQSISKQLKTVCGQKQNKVKPLSPFSVQQQCSQLGT